MVLLEGAVTEVRGQHVCNLLLGAEIGRSSAGRGLGEGADVENQGSGGADHGQGQVVATGPACATLAAPAMMEGTLAAHCAKSHCRCMICQGLGHSQQVCPSAEGLM